MGLSARSRAEPLAQCPVRTAQRVDLRHVRQRRQARRGRRGRQRASVRARQVQAARAVETQCGVAVRALPRTPRALPRAPRARRPRRPSARGGAAPVGDHLQAAPLVARQAADGVVERVHARERLAQPRQRRAQRLACARRAALRAGLPCMRGLAGPIF